MWWQCLFNPHASSQTVPGTQRERGWDREWPTLPWKSGEHIWIAVLATSCQLLSLAGGEESNGIYTSRQKSRGRQRFFSKPNKSPGSDSHGAWQDFVLVRACVCEGEKRKWDLNLTDTNTLYVQVECNAVSQALRLQRGRWKSTALHNTYLIVSVCFGSTLCTASQRWTYRLRAIGFNIQIKGKAAT